MEKCIFSYKAEKYTASFDPKQFTTQLFIASAKPKISYSHLLSLAGQKKKKVNTAIIPQTFLTLFMHSHMVRLSI